MFVTLTEAYTYALVSVSTAAILFVVLRHVSYDMGSKKEIDAFRLFLLVFLLFVVTNGFCIWANYNREGMWGTIFTTINQSAICASAYFWMMYIEERLNPLRAAEELFRYSVLIPMMSMILLVGSSGVTHLIFYYDEAGRYQRGPMYPMIMLSSFLYLALGTIEAYRQLKYAKTKSQRRQIYYLMLFIVFPILAGVIDFLHAHLPTMELISLFGIILIYMNLQQEQVYRDALTGLNNRRLTDEYLTERLTFVSPEEPLYFFISDIDYFKTINDRFGHLEGDRALVIVAEVLKQFKNVDHYFISRWGGDEFVMIIDRDSEFDPEDFIHRLNSDMTTAVRSESLPYDINMSLGYVKVCDPGMQVDDLLNAADQNMYRNKEKNKAGKDS